MMMQEGVVNPVCSVSIQNTKVFVEISGSVSFIDDIKLSLDDKSIENEIYAVLLDFKSKRFFPAQVQQIRKSVLILLRDYGYLNPQVDISFNSGTLYCNVKVGRKYVLFIQIDGVEELIDISEDQIREEIINNFSGNFSQYSVKLFIENFLKTHKIHHPQVYVSEVEIDEQISNVKVVIKLPKMFYLDEFRIDGLKALDEDDIKYYIGAKERNIITVFYPKYGLYQEDQIDAFVLRIKEFARLKGFFDFKIKDFKKDVSGDSLKIKVSVEEGERAIIDNFYIYNFPQKVSDDIELPETPVFYDKDFINELRSELEKLLRDYGFEDFDIVVYENWRTKKLVDVTFVYTGDKSENLVWYIFANSRTDTRLVKDISEVEVGDKLRNSIVESVYDNLSGTRYFDYIDVKPYTISADYVPQNSVSPRRYSILVINLQEGKLNEFEVSGGISSVEGVRGSFEFTRRNIFYWGLDFSAGIRSSYWVFPFGREMGLTFLGFHSEFVRRKLVEKFDVSLSFSPKYESTFLYNIQKPLVLSLNISRDVSFFRIMNSFSFELRELTSWPGFSIIPESKSLRNLFFVSQGISFKKSGFSGILRNDVFLSQKISDKIELSSEFYDLREFWGIGAVFSIGRIFVSDIFYVPLEHRFFLGGFRGPRGYREMSVYSDIVPELRNKSSNKVLIMTEIFSPKLYFLRSYVFFDVGSVFYDSQNPFFYKGVGPGVFMDTPFGSFRFELGYGIDRKIFMIHFSFGLNRFTL
ncbi:MAG: BamA/TamA family outer membrane protein [bacterium]|nr:BamA/TamA family outer membrane protein [bacterium]MDW8087010.1 BamA/TamA family outer membrane protein [Candidatus Calescibacterium sp.]